MDPAPAEFGSECESYYEAMGYDTLVPNPNFARLLNIRGEFEVKDSVVRIVPAGTFVFPQKEENYLSSFLDSVSMLNENAIFSEIDERNLGTKIRYIPTFRKCQDDYMTVSDYTDFLPDDYFDDADGENSSFLTRSGSIEPDFDSFAVYSNRRHTILGKLIENLIGTSKAETIYYNSKRRIKGSFYAYNYGVYGEIGVKGWTDKKQMIGWHKVKSDELRVGWRNVVIDIPMPSDLKEALKGGKANFYGPPKPVQINEFNVQTATILLPDQPASFWDKILAGGVKALVNFLKSHYDRDKLTEIEKAEAFVVMTPNKLKFVAKDGDVVKYDEKSYCHVFAREWMEFTVDWSNLEGVSLNGITPNNFDQIMSWVKMGIKLLKREHMTLKSGEVYICARLNDQWRGMKIIRKEN